MSRAAGASVAVGYIRVSQNESERDYGAHESRESRESPTAQRAAIEGWAAAQGVEVRSWQLDLGVSDVMPIAERPGLVAAYGALRTHRAGILVAANVARFSQDVLVAWLIERAALVQGAIVRTADGSADSAPALREPADGAWTRGAIDLARAYERVAARSRTRAALAEKRARGERIGAVPYGYRLAADGLHLEADDVEQRIVAMVRQLSRDGLSQRAIVASLAKLGVVGRTGAPLQQTQIARLLRSAA